MVGLDVSVVQFLLHRRGIRVGIDGIYGGATQRAVRRFQAATALAADGIVGPATTLALAGGHGGPAAVGPGASRTKVRAMLGDRARHYGVSPELVRAVAWMESGFHWNVTSSTGAWGVMQVMPGTWRFVENVLAGKNYTRSARGGIRVGILYLRHVLREFNGNRRLALAAYYQGPKAVRQHGGSTARRVSTSAPFSRRDTGSERRSREGSCRSAQRPMHRSCAFASSSWGSPSSASRSRSPCSRTSRSGHRPNLSRPCTITGTAGPDLLKGTTGNDVVCGLGGNDTIGGNSGNDVLRGGPGDDRIQGDSGIDVLQGGLGADWLWARDGRHDHVNGGKGYDRYRYDQSIDGLLGVEAKM